MKLGLESLSDNPLDDVPVTLEVCQLINDFDYELNNELLEAAMLEHSIAFLICSKNTMINDGINSYFIQEISHDLSTIVGFDVTKESVDKSCEALAEAISKGTKKLYETFLAIINKIKKFIKKVLDFGKDIATKVKKKVENTKRKLSSDNIDFDTVQNNIPKYNMTIGVMDYLLDSLSDMTAFSKKGSTSSSTYNEFFEFESDKKSGIFKFVARKDELFNTLFIKASMKDAGFKSKEDYLKFLDRMGFYIEKLAYISKQIESDLNFYNDSLNDLIKGKDPESIRRKLGTITGISDLETEIRYRLNNSTAAQRVVTLIYSTITKVMAFNPKTI